MKKSYYSSRDPERCVGVEIQLGPDNRMQQKFKCHRKALWRVGLLRLCYTCFEHYLETHPDVDLAEAERLSDSERDFIEHNVTRRSEPIRQFPQRVELCRQSHK